MRAITIVSLIFCPELPATRLRQSIYNPTVPLRVYKIFYSPALSSNDQGISVNISRFVIVTAIKRLHPESVMVIFVTESNAFLEMPKIDTIPASRT
jgi:hypothetical protein